MKELFDASGIGPALPEDRAGSGSRPTSNSPTRCSAAEAATGRSPRCSPIQTKRGKLAYFGLVTSSLSEMFGTRLSGELGLTAGFSSLDGD